jgi:DDE_Tnp_1-associated/Transposase DDE domain
MSPPSPLSLAEVLADLPDARSRRGRRFPLVPVLSLVTLGLLLGRKSLDAIARLGPDYGPELLLALGFPRGRGPAKSTLSRLLRRQDADALEACLARWVQARLPADSSVLSLDGKTARGSRDGEVPGHHFVSAYTPYAAAVLGQLRVDAKTNEHKAALQLLGLLPLAGRVVVGDAAFCQRDLAQKVVEQGGDYLFTVKANQPGLEADVAAGFGFAAAAQSLAAAFSPGTARTAAGQGGDRGEQGARPVGATYAAGDEPPDAAAEVAGAAARLRGDAGADREGRDDGRGGVRHHQPGRVAGGRVAAAGAGAGPLADRERPPLGAGHDAGGGRLPGALGRRAADPGGVAQRGRASAVQ